ncbi:MAG TPA: hypothetical protein PLT94_15320 [Rhodocyclaceae bacterium]|nr:hypothetical protein [Accumulibacter sp.]HNB79899.1 hypothetical protein [Rhodocyclaceae bacterium]HNC21973.1 hypothetical protein [Accumulibacter sp.]HNI00476.1 hypothetical protein [Rhodocyclaceae bacterium]
MILKPADGKAAALETLERLIAGAAGELIDPATMLLKYGGPHPCRADEDN